MDLNVLYHHVHVKNLKFSSVYMKPRGFVWDTGNREKNWKKHRVTEKECEEVFGDKQAIILPDDKHSTLKEKRFMVLGISQKQRKLAMMYTLRGRFIRVISARDQSRRERRLYEEKTKTH